MLPQIISTRVFHDGKHAFSFDREKNIIFPTDKIIANIRPFGKGKRSTFFFTKKKKVPKKKLANLRFDRRCVWDSYTAKPAHSSQTRT